MAEKRNLLLKRKITIPPPTPGLIPRKNLLTEMEKASGKGCSPPGLVLIIAPAGYGKSSFVREWAETLKDPVAWYSIDEKDNDLHRFLTYLIHAIEEKYPGLGKGSLDMLSRYQSVAEGNLGAEALLTPLMNELYGLKEPLTLILDQYHHIGSPEIHEAMVFFMEHLPEQLTTVVVSRFEPPWPLHQWRSGGRMLEITADHLAFTREETETFMNKRAGLSLNKEDLDVLQEKTEGWVTALQLITGSFGEVPGVSGLMESISGDHEGILEYLTEEALNRQLPEVREFLLDTCVLPALSRDFCDEILEKDNSREQIDHLLRQNLFLIPLDREGRWYRYHPLFRESLLRHRSRKREDSSKALYQRAARWFEEEGSYGEAVSFFGKAEDYGGMGRVLEQRIDDLWETEGFRQVFTWLEEIPVAVKKHSLRLLVYGGHMNILSGNPEGAMECFSLADQLNDPEGKGDAGDQETLGILETLRTTYHIYNGNMKEGFISAEKAFRMIPDASAFWKISAAIVLGDVKTFSGDLTGAYEIFQDAYRLSRREGNALSTVSAAMNILKILWMRGDLPEARRFAEESLKIAKEEGYSDLPRLGVVWVFLGELLREEGNLEEGERCATRGLTLCEPERILYGMASIFLAAIALSKKEYDLGLDHLARLEAMKHEAVLPELIFHLMNSWKARLLMEKGEISRAKEALEEADVENLTTIFFSGNPAMVKARLLLLEGEGEKGKASIRWLQELPQHDLSRRLMINLLLLEARMEEDSRREKAAEDCVIKALKIGKGRGFRQIFSDEGRIVDTVFARLLQGKEHRGSPEKEPGLREYLELIGQDLEIGHTGAPTLQEDPGGKTPSSYETLVEDLTERELEILNAISRGLSNVDISSTMHLSIHTVKWHNKNIFGKLGVNSRTRAVVRGRELELIP